MTPAVWTVVCCLGMLLAARAADLATGAEASWLLMVEAGHGEAEHRRITQKSIFVGPQLGPRAHRCKEGHRFNHLGQCVKVLRPVNPVGAVDLLLHRLHKPLSPSASTNQKPSAGPLHFSLPLSNLLDHDPTEPASKVNATEVQALSAVKKPGDGLIQNATTTVTVASTTSVTSPTQLSTPSAAPPAQPSVTSSETPPDQLLELFLQKLKGAPPQVIPPPFFQDTSLGNATQVVTNATTVDEHSVTNASVVVTPHNSSVVEVPMPANGNAILNDSELALDLLLKRLRGELSPDPELIKKDPVVAPAAYDYQREGSGDEAVPLLEELAIEQHLPLVDAEQPLDNETVTLRSTDHQDTTSTEQTNAGAITNEEQEKRTQVERLSQVDVTTTTPVEGHSTTDVGVNDEDATIWLPYLTENYTRDGEVTENDNETATTESSNSEFLENNLALVINSNSDPVHEPEILEDGSSVPIVVEQQVSNFDAGSNVNSSLPLGNVSSERPAEVVVSSLRPDTLPPTDFRLGSDVTLSLFPSQTSVQSSRLVSSSSVSVQSLASKPNSRFRYSSTPTLSPNVELNLESSTIKPVLPSAGFFPDSHSGRPSAAINPKPLSFFPSERSAPDSGRRFFPDSSPPTFYPSPLSFGAASPPDSRFSSSSRFRSASHSFSTSVSGFDTSSGSGFASTGSGFSPTAYDPSGIPFEFPDSEDDPTAPARYEAPSSIRYPSDSSGDSPVPPVVLFEELVANLYNRSFYEPQVRGS